MLLPEFCIEGCSLSVAIFENVQFYSSLFLCVSLIITYVSGSRCSRLSSGAWNSLISFAVFPVTDCRCVFSRIISDAKCVVFPASAALQR